MVNVFISHRHEDKPLADAISKLLRSVMRDEVEVTYSSDLSQGGGIPAGEEWFPWILDKIRDSDVTVLLLTPQSTHQPWILWEAGAVSGVALATHGETAIVPVRFGVGTGELPAPLKARQSVVGDERDGMQRLLDTVHERAGRPIRHFELASDKYLRKYLEEAAALCEGMLGPDDEGSPPFILTEWGRSLAYPLSVVRIGWSGMSNPHEGRYEPSDQIGEPWIFDCNQQFIDLYQIQTREGEHPSAAAARLHLTFGELIDRLRLWMSDADLDAFLADQARLRDLVIFKDVDAMRFRTKDDVESIKTEAPVVFNERHPVRPGQVFLPCLLAKRHQGNFPHARHNTYLLVVYVDVSEFVQQGAPVS